MTIHAIHKLARLSAGRSTNLLVAVARERVDVAHVAAHQHCSGRCAQRHRNLAAAEDADGDDAAVGGADKENTGIGA